MSIAVSICWRASSLASWISQWSQCIAKCRFEFFKEHIGHRAKPSCWNGNIVALHLLWPGERLSAPPPDERQIVHQVPDPTEALALMASATRALLCTTHLLDIAVRSILGANMRNWSGVFFRMFPEHNLCSLPGRVVGPALSRDHFSLADLRETSRAHNSRERHSSKTELAWYLIFTCEHSQRTISTSRHISSAQTINRGENSCMMH